MLNERVVGLIHIGTQQPSAQFLINQLQLSNYEVKQYDVTDFEQIDTNIKLFILNLFDNDINIDELINHLNQNQAKVIFNDAKITNELVGWNKNRWLRHVLHKIDQSNDILPKSKLEDQESGKLDINALGIKSVWILLASIGGPEALIKFFREFEGNEPVLFIIVQHMDSEFSAMMEKQLNKNQVIPVKLAASGAKIQPSSALLVPVDEDIYITGDGFIAVKDVSLNRVTTPCMDDVCADLIETLASVNLAVFSGMAKDGVKGATNVSENGGKVITQSAESCVVSAIAEEVRKMNMSLFDGDPVGMAQYIKETLTK
jgi:chemotaxis response regulator CheB